MQKRTPRKVARKGAQEVKKMKQVKVVKAPEMAKVIQNAQEEVLNCAKEKRSLLGIVYNPKQVNMGSSWSKEFKELFSKSYAFKACAYNIDSKYRNNIAYISDELARLNALESLNAQQKAYVNLLLSERLKSQACLRAWNKQQRASLKPVFDEFKTLYPYYLQRFEHKQEWYNSILEFCNAHNQQCNETLARFIDTCVGSRVAKTKDYHACMVDNLSESAFCSLVLACFLQLGVDKSQFSMKIVKSTLEGVNNILIEEFDEFTTVRALDLEPNGATVKDIKRVLVDVGAELPKSGAKRADYVKAYKKAKKAGLFVEY